jgi:malic enzyme
MTENHPDDEVPAYRRQYRGVIGVTSKIPIKDVNILSLVYTPGVAEPCLRIAEDPVQSYLLTCRGNTVGILTDGSGLFRLGQAGPGSGLGPLNGSGGREGRQGRQPCEKPDQGLIEIGKGRLFLLSCIGG